MSSSLFSDQSENIDPFKSSRVSEDNERSVGQSSIVRDDHSLIPNLHRLCLSCHAFLWTRLSRLLTVAFFALLDLARRLKQIRPATLAPPSSTSTLDDPISLSSIQSSRSVESDSNSMTHLLVHPPLHRSENIRIHANKSSTTDSSCHPRVHSVDENLFFSKSESNDLLQLIQRFTSEPQLSYCFSLPSPSINEDRSSTIEPVTNIDDRPSDNVDVIYPNEMIAELPSTTATAESTSDAGDDDALIETNDNNASVNQIERHFRRRKRRPSLTRVCVSTHDNQELPRIENLDINNNLQESPSSSESSETPLSPPSTPGTITDLRSRRLRQRFYRRRSTSNTSPPRTSPTVEFFVPTEPSAVTPPPSPTSPPTSTSSSGGKLKRTGSLGNSIKKMVRFADSIGRELAQVQYIQSTADEENAVTPKQSLYGSKYTDFEPKPWSFEVALNSRPLIEHPKPKRFFCLYRQPNSEHPDIYLHDVWKNQVKLEYADIRSKPSGDLFLSGTLWVTNASYFKYVTVKYTFNQWMNSYEHEARHRCHSNDFRNLDQFEFQIDLPNDVDRIDFVLRYCVNYQEYWDNNEGRNYTLQSETSSTPQTLISLPHDCDFNEMRFY